MPKASPAQPGTDTRNALAETLQEGLTLHRRGTFEKAARLYEKVLRKDPTNLAALNFLADARLHEGKPLKAAQAAAKALQLKPDMPSAHFVLGNAYLALGRSDEGIAELEKTLELKPDYTDAMLSLGNALREAQKNGKAIEIFERLIALDPTFAEAHYNLANTLREERMLDEAAASYKEALRLTPDFAAAHANLAGVYMQADHPELALGHAEQAAAIAPHMTAGHINAGNALRALQRLEEAEACYRTAIGLDQRDAKAHDLLANVLQGQGRFEEAFTSYQTALKLQPRSDLFRGDLSTAQLASGRIEDGWKNYESRFNVSMNVGARAFPHIPRWNGEPLDGKTILVWKEQGIGDDLRFISCLPDLLAKAGENATCRVETDPRLVRFYGRSFPGAIIEATGANDAAGDIDYQIPAGSLPGHFRTSLAAFPSKPGYLTPDAERAAGFKDWLDTLGPGLKIGFAWRSGNMQSARSIHYTAIEDWADLFATPGFELINLQYGEVDEELAAAEQQHGRTLHKADVDLKDDLDGAAALTSALDLVITPATSVGDMAGALGIRSFTYTSAHHPMMLGTDALPWYPATRIFARKWQTPMSEITANVTAALKSLL
ncbi:tetratricopeptide repeat protein [Tepidicaulis sp. LMO-SS28]|uniref:tetratricopeptide repeat protein n=1 Tax=Tepidicaulis sp. LMO-SS28 TaxID=3447455 RepID=UPI003EE27FCD